MSVSVKNKTKKNLQPHAPTLATSVSTSKETSPDDKQSYVYINI